MKNKIIYSKGYKEFVSKIKEKIRNAQYKAISHANRELIILYWEIGMGILKKQKKEGWGAKIIDKLSDDLKHSFPDMKGFSTRNLKYMRKFAEKYNDFVFVQQLAAQIPWFHNCVILDKINNFDERKWYIQKTIENGWSRNVLVHQIESNLYERQGKAITNFKITLPKPQSDLAQQTIKDPYIFDFLTINEQVQEKELETNLLKHITKFLLELGQGFSFLGNQYHLEVGNQDYYIDLLFYHLKLKCYIVIELKMDAFKPEYAGKLNFYLSAIDDILKSEEDNPCIGLLLCKEKNKLIVEYALRDVTKPMGVSQYKLTSSLPKKLKSSLPSIKELKDELKKNED